MSIFFFIVAKKGQKWPNSVPPKSTIKKHSKTTFRRISFKKLLKRWLRRISFGPVSKSTASTHLFFYPPLRRISFSKSVRSSTHFFTLNTKRLKSQRNASKRFKLKEMRRKQQTLGKKKKSVEEVIYSFLTYFLEEMRRRGSQGKEMRRRVKKCAFYIVDFGGTEMAASGYNQKKMDIYSQRIYIIRCKPPVVEAICFHFWKTNK